MTWLLVFLAWWGFMVHGAYKNITRMRRGEQSKTAIEIHTASPAKYRALKFTVGFLYAVPLLAMLALTVMADD